MARWQPVPIVGGAYGDETRPWSVQDTVNYLPVPAEREGTRSVAKLVGVPGMVPFADPGQVAPVRGLHDVEGLLLAVIGRTLYRVMPTGVMVRLGTIPGVGRVSMAHNQAAVGHEVLIANGQSGYVFNTNTGALTPITDEGFPGMRVVDFVDGYLAGVEPSGRYWFHSDLRKAAEYNTLDRQDAEAAPDRIVGLIVSHREVMVMGRRSGQFFRNTGAAQGTFQNANGTEMEVGLASAYAIARLDNTVYWLGHDGIIYRLNGNQPQRVSVGPVEQAIAGCDISKAFAFTFEDRGHKIFYLTLPDGQTWGYDVWTNEFHRRESKGLSRWRVSALVRSGGRWIAGDYANGRLYRLDWDVQSEAEHELVRRRVTGMLHDNQNSLSVNAVSFAFDTGRPAKPAGEASSVVIDTPSITGDAPDAKPGDDYAYAYTVFGTPPLKVTRIAGLLPPGLSLSEAGELTGSTAAEGTYTFTLQVSDTYGQTDRLDDTIRVAEWFVPVAQTWTTSETLTAADVNLPACEAGDLLIMSLAHGILAGTSDVNAPSGWTELARETAARLEARWFSRVADGSEGATVTVTGEQTGHWSAQVHRIPAGEFAIGIPPEIGTTQIVDPDITPPALTPSWGAADTLWLLSAPAQYNHTQAAPTGFPYATGALVTAGPTSGTFRTLVSSCYTESDAATLTPGPFDADGGSAKTAATIAVKRP